MEKVVEMEEDWVEEREQRDGEGESDRWTEESQEGWEEWDGWEE